MKKKTILTFVLGCMICVALIAVGVYAVSYLKFNVVGTIDFISYDKLVYIEKVEVKNFAETTDGGETYISKSEVLEEFNGKYLRDSNAISQIDLSGYNVINGEDLIIEITLMSLFSDYDLCVACDYVSVEGVSISYTTTILPKNESEKVSTGTSKVFAITISNSTSGTVNLSSLSINISFVQDESLSHIQTGVDSNSNTYYYVEMGTFDGNPIRWRYMSEDGVTPLQNGQKPSSLSGYYILETETYDGILYTNSSSDNYYDNGISTNDYAMSSLRERITSSQFLTDFNISEEDPIYQKITAQSLSSLYTNVWYNKDTQEHSDIPSDKISYYTSPTTTATDKFFAPSLQEVLTLGISMTWGKIKMEDTVYNTGYWTRSLYPEASYSAYYIADEEIFNSSLGAGITARPAFIIA